MSCEHGNKNSYIDVYKKKPLTHPGRIVPSISTIIHLKIWIVVVVHGERTAMPGFILCLRVHSLRGGGTVGFARVPLLAAIRTIKEEVVFRKALVCHPFLVVGTLDAVQLVNKVREPPDWIPSLSTPMMLVVGTLTLNLTGGKGTRPGLSAREVDGPGKRIMLSLRFNDTRTTSRVMLITALLGSPVDLKVIGLVQLGDAMTVLAIGEPGAVPTGRAPGPWVGMDGITAGMVALLVVIEADAHGAIATARPRVEDAPSTVSTCVGTALGGVGGRCLGRLSRWLGWRRYLWQYT